MLLFRGSRLSLLLTCLLTLATAALAYPPPDGKGGGNGGGGDDSGGEDPPPMVLFELQRYEMPADYGGGTVSSQQMNVFGELVGYYPLSDGTEQPFYINVRSGAVVASNLNDLPLDPDYDVPDGWYIYAATGINNSSDICGALALSSDPEQLRGFVLELIPDPHGPDRAAEAAPYSRRGMDSHLRPAHQRCG